MKFFYSSLLFVSLFFGRFSVRAQQTKPSFHSLSQLFEVTDTTSVKEQYIQVRGLWLNDTIKLNWLRLPVVYDLETIRKSKRDSTFMPSQEQIDASIAFTKTSAQNCFSYALEQYFLFKAIDPQAVFNSRTAFDIKTLETILKTSFRIKSEFPVRPRRNLKREFEDGTLLVFRNEFGWRIHAVFYNDGIFYSKNGGWEAREYEKLKKIVKVYFDTKTIECYELDTERIAAFLGSSS